MPRSGADVACGEQLLSVFTPPPGIFPVPHWAAITDREDRLTMEDGVPRRDFWGTVSFPLSPALCCDASRGVQDMQGSKETRTMCAATGRGSGQLYPPHKQLAIVSRDWMLVKVGAQAKRLVEDVQRRR